MTCLTRIRLFPALQLGAGFYAAYVAYAIVIFSLSFGRFEPSVGLILWAFRTGTFIAIPLWAGLVVLNRVVLRSTTRLGDATLLSGSALWSARIAFLGAAIGGVQACLGGG